MLRKDENDANHWRMLCKLRNSNFENLRNLKYYFWIERPTCSKLEITIHEPNI